MEEKRKKKSGFSSFLSSHFTTSKFECLASAEK
jgi:hypothetical protein